jgi:hypothetical protein
MTDSCSLPFAGDHLAPGQLGTGAISQVPIREILSTYLKRAEQQASLAAILK